MRKARNFSSSQLYFFDRLCVSQNLSTHEPLQVPKFMSTPISIWLILVFGELTSQKLRVSNLDKPRPSSYTFSQERFMKGKKTFGR